MDELDDKDITISINSKTLKSIKTIVIVMIMGIVIVAGGLLVYNRLLNPGVDKVTEGIGRVAAEASEANDQRLEAEAKEYLLSVKDELLFNSNQQNIQRIEMQRCSGDEAYYYIAGRFDSLREQGLIDNRVTDTERLTKALFTDDYTTIYFFRVTLVFPERNAPDMYWYAWKDASGWHHKPRGLE